MHSKYNYRFVGLDLFSYKKLTYQFKSHGNFVVFSLLS